MRASHEFGVSYNLLPPRQHYSEGVTPLDELRRQTQGVKDVAEALRKHFMGTGEFERLLKEQSEQK